MIISNPQISIAGRVLEEGETEKPISGAMVEIIAMPDRFQEILSLKALQYGSQWEKMSDRPDRKITASDGYFYFVDLPQGIYTLAASIPGSRTQYGTKDFSLTEDSSKRIITAIDDIDLFPVGIQGQVIDSDSNEGIGLAKIQVDKSTEFTLSNFQGNYRLGVEISTLQKNNKVTLNVSATGYDEVSEEVNIDLTKVTEKDFSLERQAN
ncbi:carboxypeptidase regulatory-like domain-containing protein [Dapis sp. BLCC M229]